MNINLIYEGKNYNFDIPNDVTLDYLKDLSSKIFNTEKTLLDLMYNNKKLSDDNNNILIRDLIPEGDSNVILTVQVNKNMNINTTNKTKKPKESKKVLEYLKERTPNNDQDKEKKIIIPKEVEEEISVIKNKHEKLLLENLNNNNNIHSKIKSIKSMLSNNKLSNKEMSKKDQFNNTYIQKNGELLFLWRQFSDKIKKIYLILYNKYKLANTCLSNSSTTNSLNSLTKNNHIDFNLMDNSFYELALYEKKIMNYLEMQIHHYKILLEKMQTYDTNNINFAKMSEFYNILFSFTPMNINRKLINSNSTVDLNINNFKLPALKLKYFTPIMTKETKEGKILKKLLYNSNLKLDQSKENKPKKNKTTISRNTEKENYNILSTNNTINKKSNKKILDNISEKSSTENEDEYKNISPLNLRKTTSNKIDKNDKNELMDYITPMKDLKLNQRKDSVGSSLYRLKYSLDKKDFDTNNNKSYKIKEINVTSMSVKDSNFTLEKKTSDKDKKKPINKYDYIM